MWKLFVDLTLHCNKYRKKKQNKKKMKEHIVTILNKRNLFHLRPNSNVQKRRKDRKRDHVKCVKFWQFIIVYSVDRGRPYSILQNFLRKGKGLKEFIATNLKYILSVSSIRYFPKDRLLKKKSLKLKCSALPLIGQVYGESSHGKR